MKKARDILIRSQLFGGLPQEYITEIEKISVENITIKAIYFL
jgi:hypothetical protein